MTGKTHQILGISAGLSYFIARSEPTYSPATFGAALVFSYIGALLPDIDQPNSKLWHMLPFGHAVGKASDPLLEHRNFTHSILGLGIVGFGLYYLLAAFPNYWGINTQLIFIITMIAYVSHLFADMWTNEGIPLLFPYKRFFGLPPKPFDSIRIATGQWFENLVIFPALTLFLILYVFFSFSSIKLFLFK